MIRVTVPTDETESRLARHLRAEDDAEDDGELDPDDRLTCHVHRRWIYQCVSSPVHVHPVTRHRWCRRCERGLAVLVDELTRTVDLVCPSCGDGGSPASTRLLAACRASIAFSAV